MNFFKTILSWVLWLVGGWYVVRGILFLYTLVHANVHRSLAQSNNRAASGLLIETRTETETFTRIHKVEDGIEWISYIPKQRQHETPILMQHGMSHGAWCWKLWQELLAAAGWESHAISLPGHSLSREQMPLARCTLGYYLSFVRDAVETLPRKPVLMGHSMGGALTQWYLRYVGQLPAAVLVAPWPMGEGRLAELIAFLKLDPIGALLTGLSLRVEMTRTPYRAARVFLGEGSVVSPEELYAQLGSEALVTIAQLFLPWKIPTNLTTPLLWLSGERDSVILEAVGHRAADRNKAHYELIPGTGHNLMMAHNYGETAELIARWLEQQNLV